MEDYFSLRKYVVPPNAAVLVGCIIINMWLPSLDLRAATAAALGHECEN